MIDGLQALLFMIIPIGGALVGAVIAHTILDFVNRKRKKEIKELRDTVAVLRSHSTVDRAKNATLIMENYVLRNLNKGLEAENEALEQENRDLMEGKLVVRFKGQGRIAK